MNYKHANRTEQGEEAKETSSDHNSMQKLDFQTNQLCGMHMHSNDFMLILNVFKHIKISGLSNIKTVSRVNISLKTSSANLFSWGKKSFYKNSFNQSIYRN